MGHARGTGGKWGRVGASGGSGEWPADKEVGYSTEATERYWTIDGKNTLVFKWMD